jgi:hypothetical protein
MRTPFILLFFLLTFNIQSQELIPYRFNATWGFADENGNIVIPTEFDEVTSFDESGHARVCIKKEWGIINKNGEIIVPIKYSESTIHDCPYSRTAKTYRLFSRARVACNIVRLAGGGLRPALTASSPQCINSTSSGQSSMTGGG